MNGEFLEALLKIRNRDATIYETDAVLFPEKDGTNAEELSRVKKQKPVYLRQVIAEQVHAEPTCIFLHVINAGTSIYDWIPLFTVHLVRQAMAEAGNAAGKVEEEAVTYLEEQDELKRDFLRV